jgi:7-cyano-7-deazaguanine synthase
VEANDLYIPYRTLLFFSAGAAFAQTHDMTDVYSGFINSNHAKELDCSAAFLNSLEALSENVGPVRFHIPFRNKTKKEVAEIAKQLGVPIGRTYSCQVFSDAPCGACPNCVERLNALQEAGLAA